MEETESPFEKAGILSRVTFSWINGLIKLGSIKPLEPSDIPRLPFRFTCEHTKGLAEPHWIKAKLKGSPHIAYPLLKAFIGDYLLGGVAFLPFITVILIQPYFVASILEYVSSGSSSFMGIHSGIGQALMLGAISLTALFSNSISLYLIAVVAIPMRAAVIALIFEKSLKLSSSSRTAFSTGFLLILHFQQHLTFFFITRFNFQATS